MRDYYHIALEPLTGRPDNLEMAVNEWKEYATLQPKETRKWDEWITLAHGVDHVEKIEHGNILF